MTCGVSLLGGGNSVFRTDDAQYGIAHCKAVERVGTRSIVAVSMNRPPQMVPEKQGTRTKWVYSVEESDNKTIDLDDQVGVCRELIDKCHMKTKGGRIRIHTCSPVHHPDKTLPNEVGVDMVNEYNMKMRSLADEYDNTVGFTQDGHNNGSIAYAFEQGLLKKDSYLSHSTELTKEDITALKQSGASVIHNPSASTIHLEHIHENAILDIGFLGCISYVAFHVLKRLCIWSKILFILSNTTAFIIRCVY